VNIFVGPNGSGKSNIVDAISFLKDAVEHDLEYAFRERHGIASTRQWSPSRPYNLRIKIFVDNEVGRGEYSVVVGSVKNGFKVISEDASWQQKSRKLGNFSFHLSRRAGKDSSTKVAIFSKSGKVDDEFEETVQVPSNDIFLKKSESFSLTRIGSKMLADSILDYERYMIFPNTLRTPQRASSERRLARDGGNLNHVLKYQQGTKKGSVAIEKITSALKIIAPNLQKIEIRSLADYLVPFFRVVEFGKNKSRHHDFNASQISDGTLRALGILTALHHSNRPSTIAIEEPEQAVHPGALRIIAESAIESAESSQIIVTTHSPDLIDHFPPESIFAVEMVDGVTQVSGVSEGQIKSVREGLFTLGEMMSMEGIMRAGGGDA
jgi:predicted ATPase